ncbi:hypothetical protein HU734_001575 [Pseudomonas wayambapalatensis]|uniref:hypothetical protein n=1 Tax=Pseudomonas sp. RW3S2 TaxID=485884 RepID=UPI001646FA5B|nr:hypothetical protein [Pseudomonas sp. RW3S2]MBC3423194.1 hypothetical protein [Pseudomonas sp. RW3S2]QXI45614.1 hypothetical protein HU734_001575 [Pseudomonas wayambapalatensis]
MKSLITALALSLAALAPTAFADNHNAPSGATTRGVAPVVGMPCEPGYKLVGDDCVLANIGFE